MTAQFAAAIIAALAAPASAHTLKLTTVYSFGAPNDGSVPNVLTFYRHVFYGVTTYGGATKSGTLFKFDPHTGVETQLYSFSGAADGYGPRDKLLPYKGAFYGVTFGGGAAGTGTAGDGTIFKYDPTTNLLTVLHSFSGADGVNPSAGLVVDHGDLYGTTYSGGAFKFEGTLFKLSLKTNALTVLHSFSAEADGGGPDAALLPYGGAFYGTTVRGGSSNNGVVFKYVPKGRVLSTLHSFAGTEGNSLYDSLTFNGPVFYGTTRSGGAFGSGTVFQMDSVTGSVTVLHSFDGGRGGGILIGGVVYKSGALYGAAETGGCCGADAGTLYTINLTNGAETVLYSFANGADGGYPTASLVLDGNNFYGTNSSGGLNNGGTIFKIP